MAAGLQWAALVVGYCAIACGALLALTAVLYGIAVAAVKLVTVLGFYRNLQSWIWRRRSLASFQRWHLSDLEGMLGEVDAGRGATRLRQSLRDRIDAIKRVMPQPRKAKP